MGTYSTPWLANLWQKGTFQGGRKEGNRPGEGTLTLCDPGQDLASLFLSEPQSLYCQRRDFPVKRGQPRMLESETTEMTEGLEVEPVG